MVYVLDQAQSRKGPHGGDAKSGHQNSKGNQPKIKIRQVNVSREPMETRTKHVNLARLT